jgi:hypothetical protein
MTGAFSAVAFRGSVRGPVRLPHSFHPSVGTLPTGLYGALFGRPAGAVVASLLCKKLPENVMVSQQMTLSMQPERVCDASIRRALG